MNNEIEVWGHKTYRPFRIYWILEEYNLKYKSYKIGSRTGETQTPEYLEMNPKGKIPLFRHNEIFISESVAAMNYVANNFEKPLDFFIPIFLDFDTPKFFLFIIKIRLLKFFINFFIKFKSSLFESS